MKKICLLAIVCLSCGVVSAQSSVLSSGDWWRLRVEATGMYRVTTAEVKEFQWLEPGPEPEYEEQAPAEEEGADSYSSDPNDREGFAEGTQTELF